MAISRPRHAAFSPWPVGVLRVVAVLLLVGQLFITAVIQRPDLLHPSLVGSDPSNYFAAGQRLNVAHPLYGPPSLMTFPSRAIPRSIRPRFCRRR